tara:strand:+ start:1656 stop:1856 length:201 start_codon:yes stop_codon:yes gene_type:complete
MGQPTNPKERRKDGGLTRMLNNQEILEQIEDLLCEILNHSSDFEAVAKAEEAHRLLRTIEKRLKNS